jgi:hypothetical protein
MKYACGTPLRVTKRRLFRIPSRIASATDSAMTDPVDFSTICFPVWIATGKRARMPMRPSVRIAVAIMISRIVKPSPVRG